LAAREEWASGYRELPVLLLGAGGFIGRRVGRALASAGAQLTRVVRGNDPEEGTPAVWADLTADGAIEKLVADAQPAVVFNLAGYGVDPSERDEALAAQMNERLVTRLASAMCAIDAKGWAGQRVVHVGSALEYGEATGDLREETPELATTLYGRTKLAGTRALARICGQQGLAAVTARSFMVYGPGEHPGRLLPALREAAARGEAVDLTAGTQRRDFTHVDDVAEGLLRLGAVPGPAGQVVNLATGRMTSIRAFAECVGRQLGMSPDQLRFGALPTRGHEMSHDPVAIGRLRDRVQWVPGISVEEGVRRTLDETTARGSFDASKA
jgi:nucleoside-diphosphate-sugar epimerase